MLQGAGRKFALNLCPALIAGGNPLPEAMNLGRLGGVEVIANPPDVIPLYKSAAIAVVPLRAGGGTRIKILEAFAFRKPVVSTSLGAEGLEARPNEHLLIADTAEDFANA